MLTSINTYCLYYLQRKGGVVEMGAYDGLQESNSHFYVCLEWETLPVDGKNPRWEKDDLGCDKSSLLS
jgi:hypothetical protein